MNSNPILVEIWRADVLESFHRGVVVISNAQGEILFSLGNPHQLCYPRSALKYIQVLPLLMSGAATHFDFTNEEIAIMCGSHNGEKRHVELVASILSKIGLDEHYLKCGRQMPTLRIDQEALIKAGEKPKAFHNNCSGKHAGFLAYAQFLNADLNNYTDVTHPIQKEIRTLSALLHGVSELEIHNGMDGCSAPIFSFTVAQQALAFARLANPSVLNNPKLQTAIEQMMHAVKTNPFSIAGTGRYCSEMMEVLGDDVIGKTGAEGIFNMSFHKLGLGVSIKIDDGKMLPQYHVAQALLKATGLFEEHILMKLNHWDEVKLKNWNKFETGFMRVAPRIFSDIPRLFVRK